MAILGNVIKISQLNLIVVTAITTISILLKQSPPFLENGEAHCAVFEQKEVLQLYGTVFVYLTRIFP